MIALTGSLAKLPGDGLVSIVKAYPSGVTHAAR